MTKGTKKKAMLWIGVLAIILSVVCFTADTGSYESNSYYGGDAYTGIQQASAQTANNVQCLTTICKKGFGSILLISGLVLIVTGAEEKEKTVELSGNQETEDSEHSETTESVIESEESSNSDVNTEIISEPDAGRETPNDEKSEVV